MRRFYERLHGFEGWVLSAAILTMAVATIANVVVRNVTGDTLAATEELNQFLIVLVCFVGLSYAAGEGRHIRMSALSDALPVRVRRWLMVFVCATTAALLLTFAWYAAGYALDVDRRSPVLDLPLGRIYWIAPLGLFLSAVQYAFAAARNVGSRQAWIAFDRLDAHEELAEEASRD